LAAPLLILVWFGWVRYSGLLRADEETRLHTHISEASYAAPESLAGKAERAIVRTALAVGANALVVALLFARAGTATHLVARMQPLRVFQVVYLAMTLMLGAWLGERVQRHGPWRWVAALALLGGAMLAAARIAYPDSQHIEAPWSRAKNPWVQAFLWVRANTPKDALFALDPDYINVAGEDAQCFRAIAEHSALADYSKDGGEASIAPELTQEWVSAQTAQRELRVPDPIGAAELAPLRQLGVSWIVLESKAAATLDCPYRNDAVAVCRLH
jgi:hypothetical protein